MLIRYEMIIFWNDEDNAFIVEVPELPGCMADGATYQEALANAEVVIHEWIDIARELERPIPQPRGRLIYAWSNRAAATPSPITSQNSATKWMKLMLKKKWSKMPPTSAPSRAAW